ncbi:MAG: flagellar biosynthesis anti-sigma factor FlgM [Firmicutes bacterium]|jgi:negative regulator of flagellin synthesis FlgM|nr:flagellar biosynthesis anti-sigma factor FlgM [Bacillota bacterium]NLO66578.1 flagellar biosynthesis anti-sigma factor FlgM [Bacillota bacterium]
MIISNKAAVQRIAQVYQEQRKTEKVQKQAAKPSFRDQVTLSTEGKELQAMLQKLDTAPDIRREAEEIKEALEQGTYKVSPQQIARKMLVDWSRD